MTLGTNTLRKCEQGAEVTNISPFGFWLLANEKEYFVNYKDYPVFENAAIKQIAEVESDAEGNLHWPSLDADIELEALENPEAYPLTYQEN
ncbi:MAG: DUF2442 domain-containing protein [Treponema sp.]|nr:DUF2442 domain-containing protein [Treponema sp.]